MKEKKQKTMFVAQYYPTEQTEKRKGSAQAILSRDRLRSQVEEKADEKTQKTMFEVSYSFVCFLLLAHLGLVMPI
jgi:hypothetical protein